VWVVGDSPSIQTSAGAGVVNNAEAIMKNAPSNRVFGGVFIAG